jgi:hypothetical protein
MQAGQMPGPLERLGAKTSLFPESNMTTTKTLLVAALLSSVAAMSFAQAPTAPKAPAPSAAVATTVAPVAADATTTKKHHGKKHAAKKVDATARTAAVMK